MVTMNHDNEYQKFRFIEVGPQSRVSVSQGLDRVRETLWAEYGLQMSALLQGAGTWSG